MEQKLIYTNLVGEAIDTLVDECGAKHVVVITDNMVEEAIMPILKLDSKAVADARIIAIPNGDENKSLDSLRHIWNELSDSESTRNTVVINVGGGMVTDIGGFAAATFKRGLKCINVPTTLLAAVDASVGGKTGINFNGIKNQIGVFSTPVASIVSTLFFNTLPQQQILSGYAEMLKHALLESPEQTQRLMKYSPVYPLFDSEALLPLLQQSIAVKERIVADDPTEKGPRKALNLGHTIGHAFESLALNRKSPIPHGYAVAWGLVTELVLSHMKEGYSSENVHRFAKYVATNYGVFHIDCKDYPALIAAMRQDKKNTSAEAINFTLLSAPGQVHTDVTATEDEIKSALDIYRDLMGI